jgi:hypothetical protein
VQLRKLFDGLVVRSIHGAPLYAVLPVPMLQLFDK